MVPARAFVEELLAYIAGVSSQLQEQAQLMSQAVFEERLRESSELWTESQERWGGGKGDKADISRYTEVWLKDSKRSPLFEPLEQSIEKKWSELLAALKARMGRALR
jgi:hypothetical protein